MPVSDDLESECWTEASRLKRAFDDFEILSCRVIIAVHERHDGHPFVVHVDLSVPGAEIAVSRTQNPHLMQDASPISAIRGAFESARLRLEEHLAERVVTRHRAWR